MFDTIRFNSMILIALCLISSHVVMASADRSSDITSDKELDFTVYLDGDEFGTHQVRITHEADETTVITRASFAYRLLFVTLYRYEHSTTETWRNGCLSSIESETDDNGDLLFVRGKRLPSGGFEVETNKGDDELDGCVHSFAYWDIDELQNQQLLNTQTGDYERSNLISLGKQALDTPSGNILANKYRLTVESGDIELWYSGDNRWLALQSKVENGSTIRYISTALITDEPLLEDDDS